MERGQLQLAVGPRPEHAEVEQVLAATGWPLRVREPLAVTEPPSTRELGELRRLRARQ